MAQGLPHFFTLDELEPLARTKLTRMVHDYYAGGADEEFTVTENRQAFKRYRILPRILVDVSRLDASFNFLGYKSSFPVLVAPMAMQRMAHPEGEIATARGTAAAGVPMILSTMATTGLETMARTGHPCLIYQLYVIRNRAVVQSWVEDAERLGYKAVMITVDAQRLGRRERDERNKFRLPDGLQLENLKRLRVTQRTQAKDDTDGSGLMALFAAEVDDSLTWDFLPWLRSITRLPIFIKGLLSAEDAVLALQYGVSGIVVSNHGGRQLDYSPSALDCLPAVVAAVGGRVPVFMDGGIRRGTDILKALALGAQAVLLGRPVLYGLALAGQTGVTEVLTKLKIEFETAMALAGCPSLSHITPDLILPPGALAPAARKSRGTSGEGSPQIFSSGVVGHTRDQPPSNLSHSCAQVSNAVCCCSNLPTAAPGVNPAVVCVACVTGRTPDATKHAQAPCSEVHCSCNEQAAKPHCACACHEVQPALKGVELENSVQMCGCTGSSPGRFVGDHALQRAGSDRIPACCCNTCACTDMDGTSRALASCTGAGSAATSTLVGEQHIDGAKVERGRRGFMAALLGRGLLSPMGSRL